MINRAEGVSLRPINRCHMEMLRQWRNDPLIWRWCRQNDLISDIQQERWFEKQAFDPTIKMYLIQADDGALGNPFVGVCGLTDINLWNRRAEFSLYVIPEFQGKGLAKAALRTLCWHGFRNLGLNTIWGETFDGNPAAKMFEELWFQKEGTRKQFYFRNGKFIDAHLYSLSREAYEEHEQHRIGSLE